MSQQRTPQSVEADRSLTKRQLEFVNHIMTSGESVIETAKSLGTDPSYIYRVLRLPHVKKYLHELTLDHIGLLAPYAARTQEQLLLSESHHVRASVAENILDRHLGKPVMRQQVAIQGQIRVMIDLG